MRRQAASRTDAAALLAADGYLFCAPENLAGTDGEGAARQVERICTGWRLRAAAPPLIARSGAQTPEQIAAPKQVPADVLARCEELGGLLAATLLMGS
ncbi:flavodoxin [Bordetella pertussis]|nr:flavodoxin [Bordetella pertussis]